MNPIPITREEYRRKFGVEPVAQSTSTLDTTPAPIRISRAEWEEMQKQWNPAKQEEGLGAQLSKRASDAASSVTDPQYPGAQVLGVTGAVGGAVADIASRFLAPAFDKTVDTISDIPLVQKLANNKNMSRGIDAASQTIETVQDKYKTFGENNPATDQFLRDTANTLAITPAGKLKVPTKIRAGLDERIVTRVADDIAKVEEKYVKGRNANSYSADGGVASRQRIAESDVLVGSVDDNGLIRTKGAGGAIERYREMTIGGTENVVRKNLKLNAEVVPLDDVRTALIRAISKSGLEGADLVTALKGVDREINGLKLRSPDQATIPLYRVQDAKLSTTKNINYLTPIENRRYRTAVARAYRQVVEKGSTKFNVKEVNDALAPYLEDIKRLERLDGARVEGGKLGKYLAQGVGSVVGMGAGSIGGPIGSAVGAAVGSEVGAALKGKAMASTFGKGTGKTVPKNAVLEQARLKIPDKKVVVGKGVKKTKEITELEDDIAKNVDAQNVAINKGDFTLVAALKEVYKTLVEALKKAVIKVKDDLTGPDSQRGFANFFGDDQPSLRAQRMKARTSSQNQPSKPPTIAQSISNNVPSKPRLSKEGMGIVKQFLDHMDGTIELPPNELSQILQDIQLLADKAQLESRFGSTRAIADELADLYTKELARQD